MEGFTGKRVKFGKVEKLIRGTSEENPGSPVEAYHSEDLLVRRYGHLQQTMGIPQKPITSERRKRPEESQIGNMTLTRIRKSRLEPANAAAWRLAQCWQREAGGSSGRVLSQSEQTL